MNRERYKRVRSLFDAALEIAESERALFLDAQCKDDQILVPEVSALLAMDSSSQQFLDPMGDLDEEPQRPRDPQRIGDYALGVICFELLSGRLPHELTNKPISEAARIVTEHDASKLGEIDASLRGDVETIVAKALEKDQARRYASVVALSEDIRRFLADEPVLARRPSTFYQLSKFTKRNKGLVTAALASIVILIVGAITATVFAIGEAKQRFAASQLSYRSLLSASSMALDTGRPSLARTQIDEAPDVFRSWEWDNLNARLLPSRRDVGVRHRDLGCASCVPNLELRRRFGIGFSRRRQAICFAEALRSEFCSRKSTFASTWLGVWVTEMNHV